MISPAAACLAGSFDLAGYKIISMGLDPYVSGSISVATLSLTPKLEGGATSNCLTLPPSFGFTAHAAGSPSPRSSMSSSSMSELFGNNDPELPLDFSENDTADASSTSNIECGCTSSSYNVFSPIIEEDPKAICLDEVDHALDGITIDLNLDVKPFLDEPYFLDTGCRPDSSSTDIFMSHVDELLWSSVPQEFLAEPNLSCFDDLFSSISNTDQDFPLPDGAILQGLKPLYCPEEVGQSPEQGYGQEEENTTQMFKQWLRSNAHWISLSDMRKIKLKTSTIDNATRQLGGGKKGTALFLKYVLMWLQDSQAEAAVGKATAAVSSSAVQLGTSMGIMGCVGTSLVNLKAHQSFLQRDGLGTFDPTCLVEGVGEFLYGHYGPCSSTISCGLQWRESRSRRTSSRTGLLEDSPNVPISNASPLPTTTFCRTESHWLPHNLHGISSSMLSPAMCSPVGGASGQQVVFGAYDTASMMTMKKQCFDPTLAATTRAARKSRMESQRWSVRRTRKWSGHAVHRTSQHLLVSGANHGGGPPTNLECWSQVGENAAQSQSFSGSTRIPSGLMPINTHQARKDESCLRLLFDQELKHSDVGNLGRIVLPKAAETFLPPLESWDGVNLVVEDMNSCKVWNMLYRFCPNKKSRMYVLENTGDFVKSYDLKEGDYVMLYNSSNRYVIKGMKRPGHIAAM